MFAFKTPVHPANFPAAGRIKQQKPFPLETAFASY
jgi:hypothetical protein